MPGFAGTSAKKTLKERSRPAIASTLMRQTGARHVERECRTFQYGSTGKLSFFLDAAGVRSGDTGGKPLTPDVKTERSHTRLDRWVIQWDGLNLYLQRCRNRILTVQCHLSIAPRSLGLSRMELR